MVAQAQTKQYDVMNMDGDDRSGEAVLRTTHLSKQYGAFSAVRDISIAVRPGEVYGFLGPNGSGKSTTISMLLGLIRPTSGTIEIFGASSEHRTESLACVGAIIESPSFYPYLSGFDNLSVLGALRGGIRDGRIREVLDIVDLTEAARKHFGQYSLGMKQRLGIAWTLIHDPDLIILDEPTNGLDPAGVVDVRQLIRSLTEHGKTVFLSSHLLSEIEQVCDRVAILKRGSVIFEGQVADLLSRNPRVLLTVDRPREADALLRTRADVKSVIQNEDGNLIIEGEILSETMANVLVHAGFALHEMRLERTSLEDIFLILTEGTEKEHTRV